MTTTNQFTLLENALHYHEAGEWKTSEDVIETYPTGAVARRGPHQALFSSELNTEAVFDVLASDGRRLRGGVRSIQLTEVTSGRSLILGEVRTSVRAQLIPPKSLVWADAFEGIYADVVLVWDHQRFAGLQHSWPDLSQRDQQQPLLVLHAFACGQ